MTEVGAFKTKELQKAYLMGFGEGFDNCVELLLGNLANLKFKNMVKRRKENARRET